MFLQTILYNHFEKLEGCEQISIRNIGQQFESDKDLKHETLFNKDIIKTVTDVVQYEDNPDNDPVEVGIGKLPNTKGVKALELALHYVEQQLTVPWLNVQC